MKQFFKNPWVQLWLMTTTLFFGSVPATATDPLEDIVEGLSKLDTKAGESFSEPCSRTAANLDKKPKLTYVKEDGHLKVEISDDKAD